MLRIRLLIVSTVRLVMAGLVSTVEIVVVVAVAVAVGTE
jgi:hypothetical protein